MATIKVVERDWVEVAADVTSIVFAQVMAPSIYSGIFQVGATAPTAGAAGWQVLPNQALLAADVTAFSWTTGKLWARAIGGNAAVASVSVE